MSVGIAPDPAIVAPPPEGDAHILQLPIVEEPVIARHCQVTAAQIVPSARDPYLLRNR